jgi:hypothetical protein
MRRRSASSTTSASTRSDSSSSCSIFGQQPRRSGGRERRSPTVSCGSSESRPNLSPARAGRVKRRFLKPGEGTKPCGNCPLSTRAQSRRETLPCQLMGALTKITASCELGPQRVRRRCFLPAAGATDRDLGVPGIPKEQGGDQASCVVSSRFRGLGSSCSRERSRRRRCLR